MGGVLRWTAACTLMALGTVAEVPEAARVLPGEYAEGGAGAMRPLPAAWGIHFAQGETQGWKFAWLRVSAQASGTVSVSVNRQFEPIAPEKPDDLAPASFTPQTFAVAAGANWLKVLVSCLREMRFEVSCDREASCDAMLLVQDEAFDPASLTPEEVESIPRRAHRTEFADALFERNPLMPLREYAEAVARHAGVEPLGPAAVWNANGAALHNGTPYFPMMMYHSTGNRNEALLAEVPLNLFPDRIPAEPSEYPRLLLATGLMYANWSYEGFFAQARSMRSDWFLENAAMVYLADEPDGYMDPIALRRVHELCKVALPEIPTCYCFCTYGTVGGAAARTCDFPCADRYPVGITYDWESVQAIGWMVDKERLANGNAPTIFAVQTFAWERFAGPEGRGDYLNPDEGGFPTERELATMTLLPVAHGARGLFFFNYRDLYGEHLTLPEYSPEGWENLKRLIMQLHVMEPALVGPEVRMPWTVSGEGIVRLLVSEDRQMGYLVVVNPTLHAITQRLVPTGANPLAGSRYREICNYGVTASFAQDGSITFVIEELGCALYRLLPEGLAELEKRSHEEIMEELRERSRIGPITDEAVRLGRRGQKRPVAPERAQHFESSLSSAAASSAIVMGDENAQMTYTPSDNIIKVTQSGILTVTKPGKIEILLVGGGGGGGRNNLGGSSYYYGGGGGGGGVIHNTSMSVTRGEHAVTIGVGGSVSTQGGDTSTFGLTAYGGGRGAAGGGLSFGYPATAGGSGGGGSSDGTTVNNSGHKMQSDTATVAGNMGNSGASNQYYSGGGGGAGSPASGYSGGSGFQCEISGKSTYYAGGGNGSSWGQVYYPQHGAIRGFYGGGGQPGGAGKDGVAFVRFTRQEQKTTSDFAISGDTGHGWRDGLADGYRLIVVTNGTTLHVTGFASPDILLVGGGGGGGKNDSSAEMGGGGGGAGGLIYLKSFPLPSGDYPVTIGKGGAVYTGSSATAMGGNTSAFGLTAYGGGFGAHAGGAGFFGVSGSGGSGGGGSRGWGGDATAAGTQSDDAKAAGNFGNAGFTPTTGGHGGGGGGAGGAATDETGGIGYECDITWENVFYAGGGYGGGYWSGVSSAYGGGNTHFGGGGHKGQTGGPGVLIIRYKQPKASFLMILR